MNELTNELIELERRFFCVRTEITDRMLELFADPCEITLSAHQSFVSDSILLQVKQAVWDNVVEQRTVRYPSTWWDAFKVRFAPAWFLRRWPVAWTVETITARELYPKLSFPEYEPILAIESLKAKQ